MDFEHVQTRLPTLSEINDQLQLCINDGAKEVVQQLLHQIAAGEGLAYDYLHERYGSSINVETSGKKPRAQLSSDLRCLAKISNNGRCSRKRKDGLYCGGHATKRPHGAFGEADARSEGSERSERSEGSERSERSN